MLAKVAPAAKVDVQVEAGREADVGSCQREGIIILVGGCDRPRLVCCDGVFVGDSYESWLLSCVVDVGCPELLRVLIAVPKAGVRSLGVGSSQE